MRNVSNDWALRISLPFTFSLRKHAYSNTLKILQPKNENFQIKNSDIFHILFKIYVFEQK